MNEENQRTGGRAFIATPMQLLWYTSHLMKADYFELRAPAIAPVFVIQAIALLGFIRFGCRAALL